jgi:hypothetical protein
MHLAASRAVSPLCRAQWRPDAEAADHSSDRLSPPRGSDPVQAAKAQARRRRPSLSGEDAFDTTLRFLAEQKAETAYFNVLVPLRGTPLYERLKAEDRLLDQDNMERWPELSCHFKPLRYTRTS